MSRLSRAIRLGDSSYIDMSTWFTERPPQKEREKRATLLLGGSLKIVRGRRFKGSSAGEPGLIARVGVAVVVLRALFASVARRRRGLQRHHAVRTGVVVDDAGGAPRARSAERSPGLVAP
ncbi:hypothetical protein MRX96_046377 [Rhipicephalus microplus]